LVTGHHYSEYKKLSIDTKLMSNTSRLSNWLVQNTSKVAPAVFKSSCQSVKIKSDQTECSERMSGSYEMKRASQFFHFNAIGDAGSSLE
jgi:DNA-binding transcriptional regulator WhiA